MLYYIPARNLVAALFVSLDIDIELWGVGCWQVRALLTLQTLCNGSDCVHGALQLSAGSRPVLEVLLTAVLP